MVRVEEIWAANHDMAEQLISLKRQLNLKNNNTKYSLVKLAERKMEKMAKKRDPKLKDRVLGYTYVWYYPNFNVFTWSKNPRLDMSEDGCEFVCEFFNGHRTSLTDFKDNSVLKIDPNDLSHCTMLVLY